MMRASLQKILTAILSIIILLSSYQTSSSLNTDGVLLLAFKYSVLSDPLGVLSSWSVYDGTPCQWHGVSCGSADFWSSDPSLDPNSEDSGRVIGVSLSGSQLLGTIPGNFGLLDRLETLNLSSNLINGSIPDTLFSLSTLRVLDVSNNKISGELTDSIGGLRSLVVLNVSDNALTGNIPRNLGSLKNLTSVSLSNNYFTGNLPGGFDRVRFMDLSSNIINGSLPLDFGGSCIDYLNLSYNSLTGEIPPEFGQNISLRATLDLSNNNFTGEIPGIGVFLNQEKESFAGNPNLCGPPSGNTCSSPTSPVGLPTASDQPIPPPAIAAIPKTFASSPDGGPVDPHRESTQGGKSTRGLKPLTITWIVIGDVGGIVIISMILLYIYNRKTNTVAAATATTKSLGTSPNSKGPTSANTTPFVTGVALARRDEASSSSVSSSSSESKGFTRWSCLRKTKHDEEDEEEDDNESEFEDQKDTNHHEEKGQLVTLDGGETDLELETLLKASAYILGASGSSIMYKAVLEDGTVLAVRRIGECNNIERMKDFEIHIRSMAKLVHPNLVRVHGFYWAADEKLVIYEYVPNGSLANARYRKAGSSPSHIPWDVRVKIARGVARGLSYIHDKKQVHGNLKPTNILLDMDMEPKISDLGVDKLSTGKSGYMPGGSTRHFGSKRSTASRESFQDYSVGASPSPSTSSIGGVSPYHPPESLRSLKPNSKWDVYSFGVVLLELLTGKVIIADELGPPVLAGLAVGLDDKTRVLRMADPAIRIELEGKEEELFNCLKLGYNCVSHVSQKRPPMKEALNVLEKVSTSSTGSSSSYYYGS